MTLLTVLVAIALAAPRYGADSRLPPPGQPSPPPRRPPTVTGDVLAVARHVRQTLVATFHCHWPRVRTSTMRPSSSRRSTL